MTNEEKVIRVKLETAKHLETIKNENANKIRYQLKIPQSQGITLDQTIQFLAEYYEEQQTLPKKNNP